MSIRLFYYIVISFNMLKYAIDHLRQVCIFIQFVRSKPFVLLLRENAHEGCFECITRKAFEHFYSKILNRIAVASKWALAFCASADKSTSTSQQTQTKPTSTAKPWNIDLFRLRPLLPEMSTRTDSDSDSAVLWGLNMPLCWILKVTVAVYFHHV